MSACLSDNIRFVYLTSRQTDRRTDGQTDGQTDRQTDRRTDRRRENEQREYWLIVCLCQWKRSELMITGSYFCQLFLSVCSFDFCVSISNLCTVNCLSVHMFADQPFCIVNCSSNRSYVFIQIVLRRVWLFVWLYPLWISIVLTITVSMLV